MNHRITLAVVTSALVFGCTSQETEEPRGEKTSRICAPAGSIIGGPFAVRLPECPAETPAPEPAPADEETQTPALSWDPKDPGGGTTQVERTCDAYQRATCHCNYEEFVEIEGAPENMSMRRIPRVVEAPSDGNGVGPDEDSAINVAIRNSMQVCNGYRGELESNHRFVNVFCRWLADNPIVKCEERQVFGPKFGGR